MSHKIILASKSPRRRELLADLGYSFEVESANCEEAFEEKLSVEKAIEKIAYTKAKAVFDKHKGAIVIGADTMVYYQGKALGKPKNREDAIAMLEMLSGNTHEVITGVVILTNTNKEIFHEITRVKFFKLDKDLIHWYVATGEPDDKAGSYGIQGKGKLFVESIEGDYFNIVGLPVANVYRSLKKIMK